MQVHVKISQDSIRVDETFTGENAEEIVEKCKQRVIRDIPFLMRPIVNSLSPLEFAQQVVSRYNHARGQSLPLPASCDAFLKTAEKNGFATYL